MPVHIQKFFNDSSFSRFLVLSLAVYLSGCGDFFAEKPTEIESQTILTHLSSIRSAVDPNATVPEVYKTPPQIIERVIGGAPEARLLYFCKYHTSDKLQVIVNKQFATKLFDKKGKETSINDYTVSSNPATNQLMVRVPARSDAEAVLEFLEMVDVPPVQVKIDCLISEVYADHTLDRETTIEIQNMFGEGISLGGLPGKPAFPGAALRDAARATFGLKTGIQRGTEGHKFNALVDMLVSRGYLKILMHPTLEVVNGQTAEIHTRERVPIDEITNVQPITGVLTTTTRYEDVIDSLQITPHVFADGYIGLETVAVIGSKSTPEGVKQIPIVTERKITNKENRIRQGESLIIGGITKTEKRSVIRGAPFLKDIPILGPLLFSSRDFEERGKEVLFILTPSISTGGGPNQDMLENIRAKHASAASPELFDPFGYDARLEQHRQKLLLAEQERLEAEAEKARARRIIRENTAKTKQALAKTQLAQLEAEQAKTQAAEAEKLAETQVQQAQAEAEKTKAEADAAKAKAQAESKAAKTEAEKARVEAEKAKAEVKKAKAEAKKAKAEAEKAKALAEKAKAEAEKAKAAKPEPRPQPETQPAPQSEPEEPSE